MPAQIVWTETMATIVASAYAKGASVVLAAHAAGVSRQALQNAFERGEEDLEEGVESVEAKLVLMVRDAQWRYASVLLDTIQTAAQADWKAAMTMLSRKYPSDYGRSVQQHEGTVIFDWRDAIIKAREDARQDTDPGREELNGDLSSD